MCEKRLFHKILVMLHHSKMSGFYEFFRSISGEWCTKKIRKSDYFCVIFHNFMR